jgi:DNA-binding response OmpR family regulator
MVRILVVEDNYLIALRTAAILQDAGYAVVGPELSLDAARRALAQQRIDLALLDVNLDGEMVFPLSTILDTRGIPYIFITSYSEAAIPAEYRDRPLMQKPFVPELLLAQIQKLLN